MTATPKRRILPQEVEYEARVAREQIDEADGRRRRRRLRADDYDPPLRTRCFCGLSLSAFATRREFDTHREACGVRP